MSIKVYGYTKTMLWGICLVIVLCWGPLAIQYNQEVRNHGQKSYSSWSTDFLSVFTNDDGFFNGDGSIIEVQHDTYNKHITVFTFHSVGGGFWIIFGIFQFLPILRHKYPIAHRICGYLMVLSCICSLIGSSGMLASFGASNMFSGRVFWWQMFFYWVGGFLSLVLALYFIIFKQNIIIHRQFMFANYGLGIGAPLFRLFWATLHWFTDYNMENVNLNTTTATVLATSIFVPLCIMYGDEDGLRDLKRHIIIINDNPSTNSNNQSSVTPANTKRYNIIFGVILFLNTLFGVILTIVFAAGDCGEKGWFDNYDKNNDNYDGNIAFRWIFLVLWMLYSYIGLFLLYILRFNKDIEFGKKYLKLTLGVFTIFGFIIGIVTFIYISTFGEEVHPYKHLSGFTWGMSVVLLWISNGLFIYYYFIEKNYDYSYDALSRMVWHSCPLPIISFLILVLDWFPITKGSYELVTASLAVYPEVSYLMTVIWIAFETRWDVIKKDIGIAKKPWTYCCNNDNDGLKDTKESIDMGHNQVNSTEGSQLGSVDSI